MCKAGSSFVNDEHEALAALPLSERAEAAEASAGRLVSGALALAKEHKFLCLSAAEIPTLELAEVQVVHKHKNTALGFNYHTKGSSALPADAIVDPVNHKVLRTVRRELEQKKGTKRRIVAQPDVARPTRTSNAPGRKSNAWADADSRVDRAPHRPLS